MLYSPDAMAYSLQSKMFDETTISVLMHCWLYMSTDSDSRQIALSG